METGNPIRRKNLIVEKSLDFSVRIVKYSERFKGTSGKHIARQMLRSGTSIGANIYEAQEAESRVDFIHKMKIASKEARETDYWLTVCARVSGSMESREMLNDLLEIRKLLGKIIASSHSKPT